MLKYCSRNWNNINYNNDKLVLSLKTTFAKMYSIVADFKACGICYFKSGFPCGNHIRMKTSVPSVSVC